MENRMNGIKMRKQISIFILLLLAVSAYGKAPVVKLETNFGDILIELFDANAPVTVDNFLMYVESGFYDGLIFHRVIPNFMIQTGGFDTNLNQVAHSEPNIINESNNGLSNLRGTVAMARATDPNSANSQFYINVVDNTFLDYNDVNNVGYCVFGQVISDMNVVDRIAHLPTENHVAPYNMDNVPRPSGPVIIYKAGILGDLYKDSYVDLKDYSVFASQWLASGNSNLLDVNASDGGTGDWFGAAVAIDANFAIVGAAKDNSQRGAAYIYEYNDGNWTELAKLTASDGAAGDYFGCSVSISANHAIIGALGDNSNAGSAYIFECNNVTENWTQKKKLTAPDCDAGDYFGQSVSISGDCAIVGAWLNDTTKTDGGAAYIFYRNQGGANHWGQQIRLSPADAAVKDYFGYSVSINGEYAVIGAIGDDPHSSFPNFTGSAYVFRHNGSIWAQKAKLTADDGAASDKFGRSVSTDGYYAIVGAYWDDANGTDSGSAYIFEPNRLDPNNWVQRTKLIASDAGAYDYFGSSVAIGAGQALVGAYQNDDNGSNSGSAYIFAPDSLDPNNWVQKTKLTAPGASAGDYFGSSVAIGMSRRAIVGAYGSDISGIESGSAYIFNLCPDADLDGDCSVTFNDLVILADNWLLN